MQRCEVCGRQPAKRMSFRSHLEEPAEDTSRWLAKALTARAELHKERSRFTDAIHDLEQAKSLDYDPAINNALATAFLRRGMKFFLERKWPEAIADGLKAFQLNPENAEANDLLVLAYRYRAGVLALLSRQAEAIADLKEVIRRKPNDPVARSMLEKTRLRGK